MLINILNDIGMFVGEYFGLFLVIGLVLLSSSLIGQIIVNSYLEEALIELTDRVEEIEKRQRF